MRKRKFLMAMFAATIFMSLFNSRDSSANSYITSAAHSINDDLMGVDYKVSEDRQKEIWDLLKYSMMSKVEYDETEKYIVKNPKKVINVQEYDTYGQSDDNKAVLSDIATAKSYLMSENILERKQFIMYVPKKIHWEVYNTKDLSDDWDKMFETSYDTYLKAVNTDTATVKATKLAFSGYIKEVLKASHWDNLIDSGTVTSKELNSFKKTLNKRKSTFNNTIKGMKDSAQLTATYRGNLEQIKTLAIKFKPATVADDDDYVTKTELLPLLAKTCYGVQESRPIVFNLTSIRAGDKYTKTVADYWNSGDRNTYIFLKDYWDLPDKIGDADFQYGDFYYYVTGNVYELYLKTLMDKGIIYSDEFNSSKASKHFLNDYSGLSGMQPSWYSSRGLADSRVKGTLGAGMNVYTRNTGWNNVSFFKDESLTRMEIYQYVEDMLRTTEKDITDTESDIIAFKFGLDYLARYNKSQQRTLKFLIAKGILNFEDPNDFQDLEENMEYSQLYRLLYRMNNKEARYDFSSITLTDAESFWQSKGYAINDLTFNDIESDFLLDSGTATAVEVEDDDGDTSTFTTVSFEDRVKKLFGLTVAVAEKKPWTVSFKLSADVSWEYSRADVGTMAKSGKYKTGVKSVTKSTMNYNGRKLSIYKLVVKVEADSSGAALRLARNKLICKSSTRGRVETVTKVSGSSGTAKSVEEYTMISEYALRKKFSEISILEDKVLINTTTNAQAILYTDAGKALVGNTIISTEDFLVQEINGEVYYNLKVILSLLDDTFLQKIGVTSTLLRNDTNFKTYRVNVSNEYDVAGTNKVTCVSLPYTKKMVGSSKEGDAVYYTKSAGYTEANTGKYYKVNDVTDGLNTVTRKFRVKNGDSTADLWLVVDWTFAIPQIDDFATNANLAAEFASTKLLTQNKVTKYLYTRPSKSKVLQMWWDSNYTASNSLMNFLMGTEKVDYVQSGYLTPSITVLCPKGVKASDKESWVSSLFSSGFSIARYEGKTGDKSDSALASFFGGSDYAHWFSNFYSPDSAFGSSALDEYGVKSPSTELALLEEMVNTFRKMSIFVGKEITKYAGYSYGAQYFITKSGVMYHNLENDSRIDYQTTKSQKVSKFKLGTRTAVLGDLKANETIVETFLGNGKHTMLFRGEKNGRYYLTPLDITKVSDTNNPLYNGGFISIDFKAKSDMIQFVVDTGQKSGVSMSFDDYKNRFSSWKDLYRAWANEYLGTQEGVLPEGLKCHDLFNFDKRCLKKAKAAQPHSQQAFSNSVLYFNYQSKTTTEAQKIYKKKKKYSSVNSLLTKSLLSAGNVKLKNGKFNGDNPCSAKLGISGTENLKTKDSGTTLYAGNRISYGTRILTDENTEGTYRFAYLSSDDKTMNDAYVAYAVPTFAIPSSAWSILPKSDGSYQLAKGGVVTAICFANYYYSGIIRAVQELSIANYVQTRAVKNTNTGDTISIAGVRFTRDPDNCQDGKGVWFTSVKMNALGKRSYLINHAKAWVKYCKAEKKSGKIASNLYKADVMNLLKDTMIRCDGAMYPFTNYIVDLHSVGEKSGIQVGAVKVDSNSKKHGIIYSNNNTIYGYKKGQHKKISGNKGNTEHYQYTRIRLKLNNHLMIRPISADNRKFALTYTTVAGNIGVSSDAPFFLGEQLSFDDNLYPSLSLDGTRYALSAQFYTMKNKFMTMYSKAMAGDIKTWILAIICLIATYLSVMSWVAYAILHYGVLYTILNSIAGNKFGNNRNGFDLVKFFTLRLYSLNDNPPLHRVVIIQFLCTVIAAVAINMV